MFDVESALKQDDYVCIYKDSSLTDYWGTKEKLEGNAMDGWPGTGGRPRLVIPTDRFVVHFHSGLSRNDKREWGFKLTAIAPVCMSSLRMLKEEFSGEGATKYMVQRALAEKKNDIKQAR